MSKTSHAHHESRTLNFAAFAVIPQRPAHFAKAVLFTRLAFLTANLGSGGLLFWGASRSNGR